MAHQPPVAILGPLIAVPLEQARNLGLDGLRQQRAPVRSNSVSGSAKVPGSASLKTLVSVMAYLPSMRL
jgi:hypothetical protein